MLGSALSRAALAALAGKGAPSPKQLAALRNLVRHLMQRYGIKKENIKPHRGVKIGHTDCPGHAFPFEQFLASL